ncbi:putative nucleotide-diphospho-sugar transferase [Beijerinckia sp. L45]|uniref:putative nucleotide-diphospho-sugar transferase n=1 Tax=Beijerinckia sp. L45 TaxID=1641855 RepID=UPI00131CD700|nr:putative nucleotide-diphospho-sugar transferase [Beijerinckia sp. L45]
MAIPSPQAKTQIRSDIIQQCSWRAEFSELQKPLFDIAKMIDVEELARLARAIQIDNQVIVTVVSIEYINVGINWILAMKRVGKSNFIVIAGDELAMESLLKYEITCVVLKNNNDYDSFGDINVFSGFSAKGLGLTTHKFPVVRFLVECGYDVIFSDADAFWLLDPSPYLADTDIAFQRIARYPRPIVATWGFAVCTGFLFFRSNEKVIQLLNQCIIEHQSVYSDQAAMNLALLEFDADWSGEADLDDATVSVDERFSAKALQNISGRLDRNNATLRALRHDRFWRHKFVRHAESEMVICHPNSPKNDAGKMRILGSVGAISLAGGTEIA